MKSKAFLFFQIMLCVLLTFFCITVKYRSAENAVTVGNFGFSEKVNDTFSHLAERIYNGACHE